MIEHQLPSNYRVSLKALIRDNEGRILLVKEGSDQWGLPGGGPDHGETVDEGLRRELREEIGAEIASRSELPVLVRPFYVKAKNRYALWLVYEVTLAGPARTTEHTQAVQYWDKTKLTKADIDDIERPAIEKLLKLPQ
jgi:ADP-ribose pyrophosphatase YjhB (NUDIX family)